MDAETQKTGYSTCANECAIESMGRGMYALQSRPNKLAANARIGPPKTINNLETRDTEKTQAGGMSSPKPVFNGNRRGFGNGPPRGSPQNSVSPQHEDIVKYLSDAWNKVSHELDVANRTQREDGPIVYREKNPNPRLQEFKPFDLEVFWGNRLLRSNGITGSIS